MAKSFSNPTFYNSGKPSFGNTFDTDDSGNYTRNKKAKLLYRHNYNGFHFGGVLGSQNNYLLFQRAKTIRNETCASCPNLTSFNTSDLVAGLYTNEKLGGTINGVKWGVNVVDPSNNNPCNNVTYVPTQITLGSNPFYWNYNIDPCGSLFGNAPCGYDNYEDYRVISKPVVTTAASLKDCCVPVCLTENILQETVCATVCTTNSCPTKIVSGGTFTTNAQLETIRGCTQITGDLIINFGLINNETPDLTVFNCLLIVTGNLLIGDTSLTYYSLNTGLKNISENYFSSLTSIGGYFRVENNASLTNLSGFTSLTSIGGDFYVQSNPGLTSISGFPSLTSIGGKFLVGDNYTTNTNGLITISGFNNLKTIGLNGIDSNAIFIYNNRPNSGYTDLSGFTSIATIKDTLRIAGIQNVSVCNSVFVKIRAAIDPPYPPFYSPQLPFQPTPNCIFNNGC
jgi:hypothetical protein